MLYETLKSKMIRMENISPISEEEFIQVEKTLNINLPTLFKELNKVCSYEFIPTIDWPHFSDLLDPGGVVNVNKRLYDLYPGAKNYLTLYSDDAGIILMDLTKEEGSIIWCSIYDAERVFNGLEPEPPYDKFATFGDFFSYLLDEVEAEREKGGGREE